MADINVQLQHCCAGEHPPDPKLAMQVQGWTWLM